MWKPEYRRPTDCRSLRYPSDLTDAERTLVAPLIRPATRGGRPRTANVREVLTTIVYVPAIGCPWTASPSDLPPRSMAGDRLDLWDRNVTIARIHHSLYIPSRKQAAWEASPTTAIIDARSIKDAAEGGVRSIPAGMTRGRRCLSANAASWSIHSACC